GLARVLITILAARRRQDPPARGPRHVAQAPSPAGSGGVSPPAWRPGPSDIEPLGSKLEKQLQSVIGGTARTDYAVPNDTEHPFKSHETNQSKLERTSRSQSQPASQIVPLGRGPFHRPVNRPGPLGGQRFLHRPGRFSRHRAALWQLHRSDHFGRAFQAAYGH